MASCANPTLEITNVNRLDTNDITSLYTMRYRLASDPDVDPSYTLVTTTHTDLGITYNYFDVANIDPGTYVVHTYLTASGSTTGVKITIVVDCNDS